VGAIMGGSEHLTLRLTRLERLVERLVMVVGYACGLGAGWATYTIGVGVLRWPAPVSLLPGIVVFFAVSAMIFEGFYPADNPKGRDV
jgi:hypothetical protein